MLSDEDWQILEHTKIILVPFQSVTKRLKGHTKNSDHGSVWEALPAVEALIEHLDKMKKIYTQEEYPQLTTSINLAWLKLDDYYKKLDDSPAYAAALLLHPRYRLKHFNNKWKGSLKKYLALIKKAVRAIYDTEYKPEASDKA